MQSPDSTCWTMIRGAAQGEPAEQDEFSRRYEPLVRRCIASRWRGTPFESDIEDVVQEVLLECFREGGVLVNASTTPPDSFRAFLFGVTKNVARRVESRGQRRREQPLGSGSELDAFADPDATMSQAFDRAWAQCLLKEALRRQFDEAQGKGERALRRIELLRLRFEVGLPIRDIAAQWQVDPVQVHRDYLLARKEFRAALIQVLQFHHPASLAEAEQQLALMRTLLP